MTTATEHVRVGDCVKVHDKKYRGRIYQIHESFAQTGVGQAWYKLQSTPYSDADKQGRWASILVDGGGSMLVAESRLEILPDFKVDNPYIEKYFRT